MPTIDLGIAFPYFDKSNTSEDTNLLLDLTLEILFNQAPAEFQSAYVYDDKRDQENHYKILNDYLEVMTGQNIFNRANFTIHSEDCFIVLGRMNDCLTIEINIDYEVCRSCFNAKDALDIIDIL